ncbi:hypothetical protein [Paenibacillus sp. YAF4_2]|uniref:hypothetical protein n=1 Tax=Paenibacillus sp. YAF4_2 TaxID=3233085 RepID=UPI003F9C93C4
MKFKKTITITSLALIMSVSGYLYADTKVSYAEVQALSVKHQSLSELENRSGLIVTGKPIESKNHIVRDKDGFTIESYTITSFEIDGTYVNKDEKYKKGDVIQVAEPYYIVDNGISPGKTEFRIEDYTPMSLNTRYLLVLKPDLTYPDLNVILGINEGKYNIGETNQKNISGEKEGRFKDELINKYKIK